MYLFSFFVFLASGLVNYTLRDNNLNHNADNVFNNDNYKIKGCQLRYIYKSYHVPSTQ